jgi:5-methylcytosine-specific restriction endonuclease McrA
VKLSKSQREVLRNKYAGRCAYCGELLGVRWHADHVEPVLRQWWVKGSPPMDRPERDTFGNLMPACAPCNIDKHAMSLEEWRKKLQRSVDVLARNQPTYRHARRFGLVRETGAQVSFHFERAVQETV